MSNELQRNVNKSSPNYQVGYLNGEHDGYNKGMQDGYEIGRKAGIRQTLIKINETFPQLDIRNIKEI